MIIRNCADIDLDSVRNHIRTVADQMRRSDEDGGPDSFSRVGYEGPLKKDRPGLIASLRLETLRFVPPFRSDLLRPVSVADLSLYEGEEFIENAYIAVLRHRPDPQGKQEYLKNLHAGMSKYEIILRLRVSAEGRSQKAKIKGLLTGLALEIPGRIPMIGHLFRSLAGFWKLPDTIREIRIRQEMMRSHINRSSESLEKKLNETILALNSRRDAPFPENKDDS